MAIAVVFPGQGSQQPGAGRPWTDHPAWSVIDEAEAATGLPLRHLVLDATAEELAPTREAQLSVLLASLLAWRGLAPSLVPSLVPEPGAALDLRATTPGESDGTARLVGVAGHSLGQITALIATGVLSVADGVRLAVARAEATTAAQAARPGGMVALLGTDEATARAACTAAVANCPAGEAWVANSNGAGQVVVGGDRAVLDAVAHEATALGARRARVLAVGGAFHTPLMAPAAEALRPTLAATRFRTPSVPVVTNHDARAVSTADGWAERLVTHLVAPVRWDGCVRRLVDLGADTVVELGPGTTLTALTRRIAPDVGTRSVSGPEHLAAAPLEPVSTAR